MASPATVGAPPVAADTVETAAAARSRGVKKQEASARAQPYLARAEAQAESRAQMRAQGQVLRIEDDEPAQISEDDAGPSVSTLLQRVAELEERLSQQPEAAVPGRHDPVRDVVDREPERVGVRRPRSASSRRRSKGDGRKKLSKAQPSAGDEWDAAFMTAPSRKVPFRAGNRMSAPLSHSSAATSAWPCRAASFRAEFPQ